MTLKNKVIVFLGNTVFDGPIKSTSLFIARNLAQHNKVYYVDYPLTIKDYVNSIRFDKLKTPQKKIKIFSEGLMDTDIQNLKIVKAPPVLTINFLPEGFIYRFLLKINEHIIGFRLKKILKSEPINDVIYINSFNFHYPNIAKIIKPKLTIYHCVDPMIVPYDIKHGIKSERQLVSESDVVICTSKALYREKLAINLNTFFVPNATELNTVPNSYKIHPKLEYIKKPIIGYLGTIERRIDYDLILQVVLDHPDKSFVFSGPIDKNFVPEIFYKIENVFFTGPINYPEVSQMINSFDLAIIPFRKDHVSDTIFPIKLFEYMSLGKPIVMTDFNIDLKDYTEDQIEYCSNVESFSKAINDSLKNDNPIDIQRRKDIAKDNTWEKRTIEIAEIITLNLKKKNIKM